MNDATSLFSRSVFGYTTLKSFLYSLFFSLLIHPWSIAQVDSGRSTLEMKIIDTYESLLVKKVTSDLLTNHKIYVEFPNKYWNFLEDTFLDNWDFDATTKALIGNDIFNTLSISQFRKLSRTLEVTLVRYAFESLSFYGEQKLNVIDIKLNAQQTLAWLKINMISPRIPDIHLDLLLYRTNDLEWKGADFSVRGITYVNLKKNSYRQDFKDLKFEGLLRKLENKNKRFFKNLCKGAANYKDPKQAPCLLSYDNE